MENIDKLKIKLEHKFKAVFNIPKSRIDFPFFVAIHDYVKFIEKDNYLRGLIYSSPDFTLTPKFLLIKKGRAISEFNIIAKERKMPSWLIAFFNLYAVYLGIKDLDNNIKKTDTTENRFKMAKELEIIKDNAKLFPKGYFWKIRSKYYGWIRTANNQLLSLLDVDQQAQKIKEIKKAKQVEKTKAVVKSEEIKQLEIIAKPAEVSKPDRLNSILETNPNSAISYNYDLPNKLVWFTFNGKEVAFKGVRSLVFHFFYMLGKINNSDYQIYKNFNSFLTANGFKEIDSITFRQSIDNINKRVKDEIKDLKSLIKLKDKNNPKEVNRYQWKMEI